MCGVWGNKMILYHKTNKEGSTVPCSVVKHLRSGLSTKEVGRNTGLRLVFSLTLLSCSSRFLRPLQQNRAQSRLLYLSNINVEILTGQPSASMNEQATNRQNTDFMINLYFSLT